MQNFCEKLQTTHDEKLGRHLVASMDISAGETLLEEQPLLVTPHWDTEQMKCAQCLRDSFVMCKKCELFPLCFDCSTHSEFDCQFFSSTGPGKDISKNLLVKNYAIFATLKLLLLLENPQTASDCEALLTKHTKVCDDGEDFQEHATNVVEPLLKAGIANVFKKIQLDKEVLHQLCAAIDAYAFEVSNRDGDSLKGVFVHGAQLPHHCVPNTVIALDEDFNMKIYAAKDIKSGEVIYNSYANPLMGTSQRQHQLLMTRQILCTCSRCLDPTELGTHMSSMKCPACTDGYATCDLTQSKDWQCQLCGGIMEAQAVHQLLAKVGEDMVDAHGNAGVYEKILEKYAADFHPNHFLIIDIKQNIGSILNAMLMHHFDAPDKELLQRKLQLCEEMLPVVRAVLPGISKLYAIALYEYTIPLMELAEMEFKLDNRTLSQKLQKALDLAMEAADLLQYEPINSPEGQLRQRILMEQKHIEEDIKKWSSDSKE